jgi:superfamily II DNA or RNA helicase
MIIGDEAHNFQAKSLSHIMNSSINAELRFGLTGSLSGAKTHEMVLRSHFGNIVKLSDTQTLMKNGRIAELTINIIILHHKVEDKKFLAHKDRNDYHNEISFLEESKSRNKFLTNLLIMQEKNSVCLFKHIKHGELLHEIISKKAPDKTLYYVAGSGDLKTSTEEIEAIRNKIETTKESITLASLLAFSEGTNIKNINDVIFGMPSKGRIKVMQSIVRGLRKSDIKTKCTLWDIADDLQHRSRKNHTLKHLFERIKYYDEEGFVYKIFEIDL